MRAAPRYGLARALSVGALVAAFAVLLVVVLGGGSGYRIHALFQDAGQLVKGDRVLVGGISIGKVSDIALDDRNRADVTLDITDGAFHPLHDGTRASIGSPSLSTEASRFVSLQPGPNSNPKLPDGAVVGTDRTEGIVDLDALFNTLDYQTRSDLQQILHGSAIQYGSGQAGNANRALAYLSPALAQTQLLTGELVRDESAFRDFVVSSAAVVSAVAPRDADLESGLAGAAALTERLAGQDRTIADLLDRAPPVLRQATGTLRDVDRALATARPSLRAAQPVAPRLARVLRLAAPVATHARPALTGLAALVPDVERALRGLPRLGRVGGKALEDASSALRPVSPIVATLRSYAPDVVGGLVDGFGGKVASYYDANGRYARIAFELPPDFLVQGASALGGPVQSLLDSGFGGGLFNHYPDYCPGGVTAPPPDRSAPFVDPFAAGHCDPAQTPSG